MGASVRETNSIFARKKDIFIILDLKMTFFGSFVHFWLFLIFFLVFEGQNDVSVASKNVETLVLGHFQGIFEKINKKSKTLKQAKK